MNLQQIKLFITVSECGTYTKAAELEGYTQSRVTQMMKELEKEMGFALFNRSHSGVTLTRAGQRLMPRMRQIMNDMDRLDNEVKSINGLTQGTLHIGTHISCSIQWLPVVVRAFRDKYPNVTFDISEEGQQQIIDDIHDRTVDLGLISRPRDDNRIDFLPLATDPMVVVFPYGHEFEKYERVPVEALRGKEFIMSNPEFDSDSFRILENMDIDVPVSFTSRNDFAIISMVAKGMGIAILPRLILDCVNNEDIEYREFDPPQNRTLGVGALSLDTIGPTEKVFIKELKDSLGAN